MSHAAAVVYTDFWVNVSAQSICWLEKENKDTIIANVIEEQIGRTGKKSSEGWS